MVIATTTICGALCVRRASSLALWVISSRLEREKKSLAVVFTMAMLLELALSNLLLTKVVLMLRSWCLLAEECVTFFSMPN
ncbi:hypothetical protein NC653_033692 [Populus alba x Populus x berolinensis]|uniref:Uncharacterized protein n=2 Tax=Populus alba x Populus x berolinensis TaxID=444605 RepID=A0AAD6LUG7_9ROSI|nr:hypothetical protein NC653_033692 [Populus alba x Populus x berolinensis]